MATSRLQTQFIEPAVCHSLPTKPACLACDNVHNLLAIGCDNGKFLILSNNQRKLIEYSHPVTVKECVQLMSFNTRRDQRSAQGKKNEHQSYLLTTLAGHASVFLWTVNGMSLELLQPLQYDLNEIPSVLEWSPVSSEMCYIGTEVGNVHIIQAKEPNITHEQIISELNGHTKGGQVVTILQKSTQRLIIIYSSGVCVLWDKVGHKVVKRAEITEKIPIAAWFASQDSNSVIVGCNNGQLSGFDCSTLALGKKSDHVDFRVSDSSTIPVQKLQCRHQDTHKTMWLLYCESDTLYLQIRKGCDKRNLKPSQNVYNMVGKVVDFKFLSQDIGTQELFLAVLTKTELVLYAKETRSTSEPTVSQSHNYPYMVSPVTCLQHCGLCTEEFLEMYPSVRPKDCITSIELIATGHADGSFRLWGCSYDKEVLLFEIARLVYSTQYFVFSDEQLEEQMQAVTLIKMDCKQESVLIVNKCNRVLLFSCKKQGQVPAGPKPQSQEIILKDYVYRSPSEKALTPNPHFCPPGTSLLLQLLQHFSCHYQSVHGKPLEPVPVNCADYNEQMGMLAVGTDRGLVVLDTCKNMLVQVIGSDNKLLKICTKVTTKNKLADISSCKVTCLEATKMILNREDPAPQLALWVGTASGIIACLVITRVGEEPLQLGSTGIWKQKLPGGSVGGVHFHEVGNISERDEQTSAHANVLVSTKENITVIECPAISSSKAKSDLPKKITAGVVKSGLLKFEGSSCESPTHFVSLTKAGTFIVQELHDQGLGKENLAMHHKDTKNATLTLFSSSGHSHCVIKCADKGPQFMYFQDSDQN